MKHRKTVLLVLASLCCMVCLVCIQAVLAEEQGGKIKPELKLHTPRIITVTTDDPTVRKTVVKSGTPVIWLNTTSRIMEIEFTGKQVTLACEGPSEFYVNDEGSFSSRKILPKSTASLCFIEKGEYDYEVVLRSARGASLRVSKTSTGKVIVE